MVRIGFKIQLSIANHREIRAVFAVSWTQIPVLLHRFQTDGPFLGSYINCVEPIRKKKPQSKPGLFEIVKMTKLISRLA